MNRRPRIFLLPGTGADERMYPCSWRALPEVVLMNWSGFGEINSLDEIAAGVVKAYGIQPNDCVVGSSLGGMVACEISKQIADLTIVLIGSAVSPAEINKLLADIHPLVDYVPVEFGMKLAGKFGSDMAQMLSCSKPEFVRSACRAIFKWSGGVGVGTRLFRIHGQFDFVIPCPEQVDLKLRCGHLASVAEDLECTEFIRSILTRR